MDDCAVGKPRGSMGESATAAAGRKRRSRPFAGRLPWEPDPEPLEPAGFGPRRETRSGPGEFAASAPTGAAGRPARTAERGRGTDRGCPGGPGARQPPALRWPERPAREPVQPAPAELEERDNRAATIAHDFNNLLAVIMVCAGEIAAGAEGAQLERADEIRAAARRGVELSRSLLAAGRTVAADRPRSGREPLAVAAALTGSRRLIERALGPGIRLDVGIAASLPHVAIGAADLERVLLNLATNAREAMPSGGTVAIAAELVTIAPGDPALGTGWHVRIGFADDGPGISAEVARRALEPYFSTKQGAAGRSGLGLAGAGSIVRAAGGELRIEGRAGAGTTVSIHLPAVDAAGGPLSLPARAGG